MTFYVYVLYSESYDRYYIGQTSDMASRLNHHNAGQELATRPYVPWQLIFAIEKYGRGEAMILERKLKNLNRVKLQRFISKYGGTQK